MIPPTTALNNTSPQKRHDLTHKGHFHSLKSLHTRKSIMTNSPCFTLPPYRATIWDMDGTLLNTLGDITESLNATLEQYHLPTHTQTRVLDFIGHGARYLCQCASGLTGTALDEFNKQYRQNSLNRNDPQTHPYDGIVSLIHDLKKNGIFVGIYTNKPRNWCQKLASRFFGEDAFDAIHGTDERNILKPSPLPIETMCQNWQVSPQETIMIGDSDVDYQTAVNAHCISLCVSYGFRSRQFLIDHGATQIADSVEQCRKALRL